MRRQALKAIRSAEQAVSQLVEECGRRGVLRVQNPRTIAQVNRTSKWLLYALAALQRELNGTDNKENK